MGLATTSTCKGCFILGCQDNTSSQCDQGLGAAYSHCCLWGTSFQEVCRCLLSAALLYQFGTTVSTRFHTVEGLAVLASGPLCRQQSCSRSGTCQGRAYH